MKIILVHKAEFPKRPPVINSTLILSELGHDVTLVTEGVNEYWKEELKRRNIKVYVIKNRFEKYGILGKVLAYLNFRKEVFKLAKKEKEKHSSVLLWVEGAYTVVALGEKLNNYPHILQIQELHEESKMQLKAISKVINTAKVVFMPEYNRAAIYRVWFSLKKMPVILPNKPEIVANDDELETIKKKYEAKLKELEKYKIIIYQGSIQKKRDLTSIIKAVKELGGDYRLLIMGRYNQTLEEYKSIDERLIHVDFTPAPEHLAYTSNAYIGVLSYDPYSLNNAFCAPNKIFEYSKFGIPLICNELPGLKGVLDTYKTGKAIDIDDVEDIKKTILDIDANYEFYSNNAREFYKTVNCTEIIKKALANAGI